MVPPDARVADIGTDHGYLGIHLLQAGISPHVIACDLRKGPLENARRNARQFGAQDAMEFRLSDGLEKIAPEEIDCAVLAGMGGDLIVRILSACSWRAREGLTLVLQPQSAGNVLRRWLYSEGLELLREEPVQDGSFLYTVMQLRAYGPAAEDALAQAEAEIYRLEGVLSCRDEQAALARLNETGGGTAGEETAALLQTALTLCEQTGGAYDPALGALSEAWGFSTGAYRVPEPDALAEAMQSSGAGLVQLDGISVTLTNGAQLDLGGIAKGYAAGRVRTILREAGVTSAIISLGGNVAAVGKKPDGSAWTVGLQDPDRPEAYFGTVSIEDACVVTSGAYQRYFEENGVCYHHILDPHTGCPAESGVKSVSVVAQDDTLADALSTALFVMGLDAGAEFQKSSGLSFEAVFVTDDNTVWITPGLAGRYRSDRPYQILE